MMSASSGAISPTTTLLPGSMMPALSVAIPSSVGPRTSVWSKLTLVSTATSPCTTLVQSHVPPSPTSTTMASTASVENQERAAAVSSSKRVGRSGSSGSSRASSVSTFVRDSSSMGSPLCARRSATTCRFGLV